MKLPRWEVPEGKWRKPAFFNVLNASWEVKRSMFGTTLPTNMGGGCTDPVFRALLSFRSGDSRHHTRGSKNGRHHVFVGGYVGTFSAVGFIIRHRDGRSVGVDTLHFFA